MSRANFKSWLGSWQEWVNVILLFLALVIAVRSIEQANWIKPQPSLILVLALSMLTCLLLVRSRWRKTIIYSIVIILGAVVTVWQAANLMPPSETVSKVTQFISALITTRPNEGTIHFAVFLILSTWIIGYISTWFILRKQNAWVGASLGMAVILINLSSLTSEHYGFFFLYLLTALLLIGQTSLARNHLWLKKHGINYPNRGVIYLMVSILCFSILVVSIAWYTPEIRYKRLETMTNTNLEWTENIEQHWSNFLADVPAKQSLLLSGKQTILFIGESLHGSNKLHFVITSDRPYYWQTQTYDIYEDSHWRSNNTTEHSLNQETLGTETKEFSNRKQITYTVETKLNTDIILTTGQFLSSDIPVTLQSLDPLSFLLAGLYPHGDISFPPDVASLARYLRDNHAADRESSLSELEQLIPEDLTLTSIGMPRLSLTEANYQLISGGRQQTIIELTRTQTGAGNTIAVISPHVLKPNQPYTITASVSLAKRDDLSEAGDDYPLWVTDYYLQLPVGQSNDLVLPERIKELSENITKEAKSPYDKVLAIKGYLSQIPYSIEVEAPNPRVDAVDHFLFTQQSGDCVYFTSAMVVMLRSVGIPSRMSVGYFTNEQDTNTGNYYLRGKDGHAWPEVYFPGYGWVGFEATPPAESGEEIINYEEELTSETDEIVETPDRQTDSSGWLVRIILFIIVGISLLIFTLWFAGSRWLQRFSGPDYAFQVYARMCFFASLLKLRPKPQQTPLEYCSQLAVAFPLKARALDNITRAYLESRFSQRKGLELEQREALLKSWRAVYPILLKHLFRIG